MLEEFHKTLLIQCFVRQYDVVSLFQNVLSHNFTKPQSPIGDMKLVQLAQIILGQRLATSTMKITGIDLAQISGMIVLAYVVGVLRQVILKGGASCLAGSRIIQEDEWKTVNMMNECEKYKKSSRLLG